MEATVPTLLPFSNDDVKRNAAVDRLAEGWYRFVIDRAQTSVAESGTFQIVTNNAPLEDPEDGDSRVGPSIRNSLTIPLANPEVEGHKAPNTLGICQSFFCALSKEHPRFPRKDKESGLLLFRGEEIEREEVAEKREEVVGLVHETLSNLWQDPEQLVDEAFFGEVIHNGDYANIKKVVAELPEGAELVPPGQFRARG